MGLATYAIPAAGADDNLPPAAGADRPTVHLNVRPTDGNSQHPWRAEQDARRRLKEAPPPPWIESAKRSYDAHTDRVERYTRRLVGDPDPSPGAPLPKQDPKAAKTPNSESIKCMKSARQTSSAESKMGTDEKKGSSPLGKEHNEERTPTSGRRTKKDHEANDTEGNDRERTAAGRSARQKAYETRSSKNGSSRKERKGREETTPQREAGRETEDRQSTRSEERTDRRLQAFAESTHRNGERVPRKEKKEKQDKKERHKEKKRQKETRRSEVVLTSNRRSKGKNRGEKRDGDDEVNKSQRVDLRPAVRKRSWGPMSGKNHFVGLREKFLIRRRK